jgi:hypothetical protein
MTSFYFEWPLSFSIQHSCTVFSQMLCGCSIYAVAPVGIGLLAYCIPHYCKLSLFKNKVIVNISKLFKSISKSEFVLSTSIAQVFRYNRTGLSCRFFSVGFLNKVLGLDVHFYVMSTHKYFENNSHSIALRQKCCSTAGHPKY